MANRKQEPTPAHGVKSKQSLLTVPVPQVFPFSFKARLIILAILSFILYADTLGNQYAFDDTLVIKENQYVQKGFSGIGKIMTTDAYDSYYKTMNAGYVLSGGRYRPLSEVVFAIEHSLFSESANHNIAFQRHLISILCYILCVLAIFYFLSKYLLKKLPYGNDIAFFATFLFAIHPIHTEVVANIKSLDEILSLLFICLTFIFSLRYIDSQKRSDLIVGLSSFFLALLSKEYAIFLVILIPMLLYLLRSISPVKILKDSFPYFIVFLIYMALRQHAVGLGGHITTNEILDAPYMFATHIQKIATELFVLGKYLWLLIIPYPLICDYSYAEIPYQNLSNPAVLFTALLYVGLIAWGIWLLLKRNVLAFPVFFYLFCLALVSNLFIDIGATMGERLVFHSSLGFAVLISYGIFEAVKKFNLQQKRIMLISMSSVLIIAFGGETVARNLQWKNDITLFSHDVTLAPNSVLLNGNAGISYGHWAESTNDSLAKKNKLDTAIMYLRKSISMHRGSIYYMSYLNMGNAYYNMQMPDSAEAYWDVVKKTYPNYPDLSKYFLLLDKLYINKAMEFGTRQDYAGSVQKIREALQINSGDAELWYNLGGAYFKWGKYDSAQIALEKALQLNPNYENAKKGLSVLMNAEKKQN